MAYWFKRGYNTTTATFEINKAYTNAVTARTVQRWFQRFQDGDFSLEDKPRSGRPQEIDDDKLLELVESNPAQTSDELATILGCSSTGVRYRLHSLGKTSRLGRWTPHKLSETNLRQRVMICTSLLLKQRVDPFFNRMMTKNGSFTIMSP